MSSGRSLHSSGARKEGRGRWLSSRGVRRSTWCGRGRARATTVLKGISGDGGSVEVDAVDSGLASARGSACSKERRVAELLDTAARHGVDGGRGYGEGVTAMASAWRGNARERGVGGEWRCPGGSRLDVEFIHPATRRGGEAGRRPAAWRTLRPPSGTCLPAWPASSSLARCWAGPAGGPDARRQVSFCYFPVFCFFNSSATLLNY